MTQQQSSPAEWIETTFPTTTVAGVTVIYDSESYKAQYYSVEWLAETFGKHIATADDPRQKLAEECKRREYTDLSDLFALDTS